MPADDNLFPEERRAEVVELRRQGKTFQQIGDHFGFSKQYANQLYWKAMHAVEEQTVGAYRTVMVDELTEVIRVASAIMASNHYAHSNGRVVANPDTGQPLVDDAPKLDAARTIIAAHARLAKLLGADAATKVESDVSLKYEVVGINPADLV